MDIKTLSQKMIENMSKVIIGKEETLTLVVASVFAGGHVLIEDVPGTGKTMLAKAFAKSIDGEFKRVQMTPDLMPSDISGLNVYNPKTAEFSLVKGPVFTNVLLADEINRTTPRTQSSLLEAMEERQVTIDGETLLLPKPFVVIATENPIETTGTYPLLEAQLDRFMMKLSMGASDKEVELMVMDRFINDTPLEELNAVVSADDLVTAIEDVKSIFVHQCVREYIADIVMKTRTSQKLSVPVSTRGTLSLLRAAQAYAAMQGRSYVEPDDVRYLAPYVLAHRIISVGGAHYQRQNTEIMKELVRLVDVPVENWTK